MQPLPWTLSQLLLSLRYPACLVQAASVLRGLTGLPPSSSMCSSGVLALHSGGTVLRFCSESLEWWWGPGRVLAHVFSVGIPWQCEENGVLRLALRQESVETKNWTLPKPLLLLPSGAMLCLTFFLLSHFLSSLSSFCLPPPPVCPLQLCPVAPLPSTISAFHRGLGQGVQTCWLIASHRGKIFRERKVSLSPVPSKVTATWHPLSWTGMPERLGGEVGSSFCQYPRVLGCFWCWFFKIKMYFYLLSSYFTECLSVWCCLMSRND
jgi:hypothetical protein